MPGQFGNRGYGNRDRNDSGYGSRPSYGGGGFGGGRGGFGGGFQQERSPPVREGEELDVRIEALGEKGDGVAKKDGFVLFIANVKQGDEVRVRVTKVLKKVGFAEVMGPAQGPVATSQPPRERPGRSQAEVKAAENKEIVDRAKQMEDSEDFGEEGPEDAAGEDPADEPAEDDESEDK